jgi:hypothetical protein
VNRCLLLYLLRLLLHLTLLLLSFEEKDGLLSTKKKACHRRRDDMTVMQPVAAVVLNIMNLGMMPGYAERAGVGGEGHAPPTRE